jgi:hypothetical protein
MRPQVGFLGSTRQYVSYVAIFHSRAPAFEFYKEIYDIIEILNLCIFKNYCKVVYNPIFDKEQARFKEMRK